MPLYDYKCSKCNEVTEIRHGFDDTHDDPCPKCGGAMARQFNPAGIVFKGSGFYVTDSRKAESKTSESGASGAPSASSTPSTSSASSTPATQPPSGPSKESAA